MIMNKLRNKISMSFYFFLGIALAGAICCFVVCSYMISYQKENFLQYTRDDLREYSSRLANQISITGYMNGTNDTIDQELLSIANAYNGRILITNKYHVIVYDSYYTETGSILVSKNIGTALAGHEIYLCDEETSLGKLLFPLSATGDDEIEGAMIVQLDIKEKLEGLDLFRKNVISIAVLIEITLLFVALVFSIRFILPLRKITKSLHHISDDAMNEKLDVDGNREAVAICNATNELLVKIQQLEDSRQQFVSNVSHELKTPMTSMKVLAESLLMQNDAPVEMYREFMSDINEEITRENRIISDLLTLVSYDKAVQKLNLERKNINELVEIVLKRVRPLAEQRGIEIVLESYREVSADVDEAKLIMALSNLIENAVKYNKDFGYVHVTVNADIHYFYLTIEDSGIGMSEEDLPHIFDRFYRADKMRSRETGGTGLGLSITKEIITKHKGTIRVFSKEEEGTTFSVRIPFVIQTSGN